MSASCGEGKHTGRARKVIPLLKTTENETLNFVKRYESKENSIYSPKPIKADMKLRGVGAGESNVLFLVKSN